MKARPLEGIKSIPLEMRISIICRVKSVRTEPEARSVLSRSENTTLNLFVSMQNSPASILQQRPVDGSSFQGLGLLIFSAVKFNNFLATLGNPIIVEHKNHMYPYFPPDYVLYIKSEEFYPHIFFINSLYYADLQNLCG